MRSTISQQLSFGDGFIDPSLYELDEELKRVDQLLSQKELIKPFEDLFNETMGRPGTPIPVYLRMQYLKTRFGLSYEEVEREVTERIPWRFFCHLSLQDNVPDSSGWKLRRFLPPAAQVKVSRCPSVHSCCQGHGMLAALQR